MDNSVQATWAGMETTADSTDAILDTIERGTKETIDTTTDTVRNIAQSSMYWECDWKH